VRDGKGKFQTKLAFMVSNITKGKSNML